MGYADFLHNIANYPTEFFLCSIFKLRLKIQSDNSYYVIRTYSMPAHPSIFPARLAQGLSDTLVIGKISFSFNCLKINRQFFR